MGLVNMDKNTIISSISEQDMIFNNDYVCFKNEDRYLLVNLNKKDIISENVSVENIFGKNVFFVHDNNISNGINKLNDINVIYCLKEDYYVDHDTCLIYFVQKNINKLIICDFLMNIKNIINNVSSIEHVDEDFIYLLDNNNSILFVNKTTLANDYILNDKVSYNNVLMNNSVNYYVSEYHSGRCDLIIFEEGGLKGLKNDNTIVIPCLYKELGVVIGNYVSFSSTGKKFGIIDVESNKTIFAEIFVSVTFISKKYILCIDEDGNCIVYDVRKDTIRKIALDNVTIIYSNDDYILKFKEDIVMHCRIRKK